MSQARAHKNKREEKGTAVMPPKKQRALIFQGGGALGAYEAGVYRVLYDWISKNIGNKDENFFDVIAGTSIGALNGAIIVSYILEKKKNGVDEPLSASEYWKGSAEKLEGFWRYIQTRNPFTDWLDPGFWSWDYFHDTIKAMKEGWSIILDRAQDSMPYVGYNSFAKEWFDLLHFITEAWDIPASAEAARRYWTTRTFGSPNVAAAIPRWDFKFWDSSYGFRFRGEQKRLPFWLFYPSFSLEESCRNYMKFPIKTDYRKQEPRFLLVTVDVQSGDTVSFDSYYDKTEYDEYDEWTEIKKSKKEHDHIIRYHEGIKWDHLSTTFSMPDLYRFSTLRDEQTGKKRIFWDGGVLSNTPLRELIGQHKKYWSNYIEERHEKIWDGENGVKIPALDVYIVDVWPARLSDDPVPSDNDFVASRKTDLILLDKTEYEESVTKMITQYMHLVEKLLSSRNDKDKSNAKEGILDESIIDNALNRKGINTFRDLLKGNFDINRIMRIERKDDLYTMGYAMEDFSARSMNQLLDLGKYDALEKLIRSLLHTIHNLDEPTLAQQDEDEDKKISGVSSETKNSLRERLEKAMELLRSKENYSYQEVMNYLYDFADEVNRRESNHQLSHSKANLLRP
jgi:NTE family protein